MTEQPVLVGIPLPGSYKQALCDAIASLRIKYPKEKDAELLGRLLVTGVLATLNSSVVTKERIARASK